ncbi:DUF1189 domain-containing protein [Litchfieldia alkalitelluris]|uniref:DUF1189 domain-containing protein n=1 Tax=Litchfieldia alkalitelluris TaxID=304268 RepID=UPI0014737D20|nr:DUF1189 domain-containing protein [Litchfieldia alkalitelluris]
MSIFKQFILSLYSPKDIARFRFQGIGKTILYVFFLAFLSLLPSAIYMSTDINNGVRSLDATFNDKNLPGFEINNGSLISNSDEPFISDQGQYVIIIDDTNTVSIDDVKNYKNAVAFLSTSMVISANYQSESIEYALFEGMNLTSTDISSFIDSIKSSLPIIVPVMLTIMYIFTSGIKFIEVSILGIVGLAIRNILRLNLKYRHTWVVAAYSMTITTVFFAIMDALKISVPLSGLLNWFIVTVMMYLVLKEIPRRK